MLRFGLSWNVLQVIILLVFGAVDAKIQIYKDKNYSGMIFIQSTNKGNVKNCN